MKVACGVCNSTTAPAQPPMMLMVISGTMMRGDFGRRFQYEKTLATEPGQTATVLVALAGMGGTPVKMSAGKEKKLPPPATEFMAPASTAAVKRRIAWGKVIIPSGDPVIG